MSEHVPLEVFMSNNQLNKHFKNDVSINFFKQSYIHCWFIILKLCFGNNVNISMDIS